MAIVSDQITTPPVKSTLAELMLPDGAHLRSEDWTIFYLNQTPRNAVAPVLVSESPSSTSNSNNNVLPENTRKEGTRSSKDPEGKEEELGELLFVLNCVRMKEDKTVRR